MELVFGILILGALAILAVWTRIEGAGGAESGAIHDGFGGGGLGDCGGGGCDGAGGC